MQPPAVIASDLDGTLLDGDGRVSERTRHALTAARDRGLAVVAVTARTTYGVDRLEDLVPLIDAAICANGAIEYVPADEKKTVWGLIEHAAARAVCAAMQRLLPEAAIALETPTGQIGHRRHFVDIVASTRHWEFIDSTEDMLDRAETIVKIKAFDPARTSYEMLEAIAGTELDGLDMCHWGDFGVLEFNAPGVNKASGLERWCAERGVGPDQVVAFGDMVNDVPMLAWAGRSYAVEGAHPDALAAARGVTAANVDDGVALVVERLLAERGEPI
ncbi:Cof-type HAD-IIB family hydrolase [Glycomyces halotolerans]